MVLSPLRYESGKAERPANSLAGYPLAYLRHAFPCCAALLCDLCPLCYALGPKGGSLLSVTEQGGDAFVAQRRGNCYIIAIKNSGQQLVGC